MRLDEGTRKAIIKALKGDGRAELFVNKEGKIKVFRLKREEVKADSPEKE